MIRSALSSGISSSWRCFTSGFRSASRTTLSISPLGSPVASMSIPMKMSR